ncbi:MULTISPECIES: hypothetical protein [unclassified Herbaspirillum]|uniref:hypothetical protein n=1 Tax=unclassified Herbaspirillum TaxID=2624150 RepID=UPI00114E3B15|nr:MULTISPECIES: hypothetical protein [unclassified Herbaspirillum]MBB5393838.1 hypothetical protein [Herbaspirillum sp. SJZ102]TQK01305.1 hypothetical protein FB599_3789 [Herbaspirillum sp. SJZ130]TQK05701.1 hypothetical protein FB598_3729 [Herbaspirillum sp. SJZ106]
MRTPHPSRRRRASGWLAACIGAGTLAGCANFSEVQSEQRDMFMVTATGVSYTMSIPALTAAAKEKAHDFCGKQQMNADLRQLVRGWRPMQVDLYFRCQPKGLSLQALLD